MEHLFEESSALWIHGLSTLLLLLDLLLRLRVSPLQLLDSVWAYLRLRIWFLLDLDLLDALVLLHNLWCQLFLHGVLNDGHFDRLLL